MGRQKKPYLEQIAIEATAAEGNGLAHVDGKVLFVKGGIPGDIVDVQVNKVRSGYSQGYIVHLVSPSPHRLVPFCQHFGECGGCTWQTLPYPMQTAFKQQYRSHQLGGTGRINLLIHILAKKNLAGSGIHHHIGMTLFFWCFYGFSPNRLRQNKQGQ